MEQYHVSAEIARDDLKYCLETFPSKRFLVEQIKGLYREKVLEDDLVGKNFGVDFTKEGLSFLLEGKPFFDFYQSGEDRDFRSDNVFSVKYKRDLDENGLMVCLSHGTNPNDEKLPNVLSSSILMYNQDYLLSIDFEGKIPLVFHSYLDEDKYWKYWAIDRNI